MAADSPNKRCRNQAARRHSFIETATLRWVEKNHPSVLEAIRAEAYKMWPLLKLSAKKTHNDYSFLSKLKAGGK